MSSYQTGFGNEHQTEALPGALPIGRNSPQQPAHGLYVEKLSGSAFTAPNAKNRRSWLYRLQPSVTRLGFELESSQHLNFDDGATAVPDPLRWNPPSEPTAPTNFVEGLTPMAACGDLRVHQGVGIYRYVCNQSMADHCFSSSDGELLIVPQQGSLELITEMGLLTVPPGYIAVVPRGVYFSVNIDEPLARGYVLENYGAPFELPERGPIGSDGLANARDFEYPVAAYQDKSEPCRLSNKLGGRLFAASVSRSPLDVVAWHGNNAPYRYELARFNVMGSTSFDHPDPSIFTVLTSPSEMDGVANSDFVVFAPRWLVMTDTFRPPWFHKNVMSEFMGLISGEYDGKRGGGFVPGGASLHNCMVPHGPDSATHARASNAALEPEYLDRSLAFMFETRHLLHPTEAALNMAQPRADYAAAWADLRVQGTSTLDTDNPDSKEQ